MSLLIKVDDGATRWTWLTWLADGEWQAITAVRGRSMNAYAYASKD